MAARDDLIKAVSDLESTLLRSAELPLDQRMEMVQVRRQIGKHMSAIANLGPRVFERPERETAFRNELSRMRSAMALHQGAWPIVSADFDNHEYLRSLRSTREANRFFISWIRAALAG